LIPVVSLALFYSSSLCFPMRAVLRTLVETWQR
jgi:hypothetical protein